MRLVSTRRAAAAVVATGATAAALVAQPTAAAPRTTRAPSDSAAAAATVERFHRALGEGDSAAALALLAEDAVILESGEVESREQYRAHHLPADIAFAAAVKGTRSPVAVTVRGDVAWARSTSTAAGSFRGRDVNSVGAELVVLTRAAHGWRISAIHWSSHARRPARPAVP